MCLLAALSIGACASGPSLDAATRAAIAGFEPSPAPKPVWTRWARVGATRFLEAVIGTDEVESRLPLVVELHGLADHPRPPVGAYLALARPIRLVMPEGPITLQGDEHAWTPVRVLDDRPDELDADLGRNVPALAELVRVVRLARPTAGAPVLVGYSQGGHQAFVLGLEHPELFALVVPMAAWLAPSRVRPAPPERAVPIHGFHAREDERVPLGPTEAIYDALRAEGWDATLSIEEGTHTPAAALDAFLVHELDRATAAIDP